MTPEQFQKMALDLEAWGLIERNGERNGEIVWRLTEAGVRSGLPAPAKRRLNSRRKRQWKR